VGERKQSSLSGLSGTDHASIAAGRHEKYPSLTFEFIGCDEFEYPMWLQWKITPESDTAALERIVVRTILEVAMVTAEDVTDLTKATALRVCRGNQEDATACLRILCMPLCREC
jgi:hypothetical protein